MRHFQPDDVINVEVYVNDELTFQTSQSETLQQFVFDTRRLDDGQHELRVVVEGILAGRIEGRAYFATQNFGRIIDLMEGPREVAWFGTVYNPISIDQSDGWEYVTDTPEDFFGDAHRKLRQGNTNEYIVWETSDLVEFTFEVFSKQPAIDEILIVQGSADQAAWQTIPYGIEDKGISPAGWHKLVVRGRVPADKVSHFIRLNLKQSASPVEIQLGQADFKVLLHPTHALEGD